MKSKQVLALIALLLAVVGGVLLLASFLDRVPRILDGRTSLGIESIVILVVGVIAIVAGVVMWRGAYFAGGVINIILGVITVFYGRNSEGIIILLSGVLGVIAPQVKD